MDFIQNFLAAMVNDGINFTGEIIPNGELHRFYVEGDTKGSKNGWYVLHGDGVPAGAYGYWKSNFSKTWCVKDKTEMTHQEWAQHEARIKLAKEKRDNTKKEAQTAASQQAKKIWEQSKSAIDSFPYLQNKSIKNHGIRCDQYSEYENLVIPLYDTMGTIKSLQYISKVGKKRFLADGKIKGNYFSIGKLKNKTDIIGIGEGFATCATVHELTNYPIACAFNCGNLLDVAHAIRAKYPDAEIIIFADNDQWPNENGIIDNRGLNKAREAAIAIGATVISPNFVGFDVSSKPTDFNDLMLLCGKEEATHQLLLKDPRENNDWPIPTPIKNELLPVESLPHELIPEPYRNFVVDISDRMQCPIDFVAVALLTITSIIIGAGCGIRPKQNDDWLVIPNLWGCIVGRPGIMKSPAVSEVIQFLDKLQNESKAEYEEYLKEYWAALKLYELRKKAIEKELERAVSYELGLLKIKKMILNLSQKKN